MCSLVVSKHREMCRDTQSTRETKTGTNTMNIQYYWFVFRRRLPYFLIVATVISAAAFTAAMNLPPAYVSQMKLLVESPQIPDELAPSTARIPAHEQLQIVEQRLLTRANLLEIAGDLDVLNGQDEMTPDRIVQSMRARTKIGVDRRAPLMTITFEARTGRKAAEVLGEYLTLIQQEDVETRTGRATQTLEFFEQEVARLNERLANRSAQILEFKTKNADALPESLDYRLSQQTVLQERLALQERELNSLTDQRERLVDIFQSTGELSRIGIQSLSPEQQELEELRKQLSDALAIYSETHPRVNILQSRIDRLAEEINAEPTAPEEEIAVSSGNTMLDVQLADLDARVATLHRQRESAQRQLDKLSDSIARTPSNAIQLDELQLEYENVQHQYNTAVDRLSRASTGERIEVMSRGQRISVIEPPSAPSKPTKPNRKVIAAGGTFFGIMAGLALVVLLEFLDKSVRRQKDLESKLGIMPLATLPYVQTPGESLRRRSLKLGGVLVILICVPAAVYAVHVYYQPLDLIADRVMDSLGVRW